MDDDDGFDLGRIRRLLDLLDNPQSKCKVVHVTGTKVKGSSAAFLSSILRAQGYSVGCYSSRHIQSIRERMPLGRLGEPVSANVLNSLFHTIKNILDRAIQIEHGYLSHFEVVLGGPFLPHIEQIIRDKASTMCSPMVSASDNSNRIIIKGLGRANGKPCQCCDVVIQIEKDIPLSIELHDVNLLMLGHHHLQNAATAVCAALCMQHQGWRISGNSIRSGLESTQLVGRSQFLTHEEAEKLGFPNTTILIDGAHTKESAEALVNTIRMAFPQARVVIVVAMANDKDHMGFARKFLSEAVCLTEVSIAGGKSRTTSSSILRDNWIRASKELKIDIIHDQMPEYQEVVKDPTLLKQQV